MSAPSSARVALITGAGRGIGRATAVMLASRGYAVAIAARTESELQETSEVIARTGRLIDPSARNACVILPLDVTRAEDVASAISGIVEHFGRLDVVVNAAGVAPLLPVEDTTPAIWRNVLETNLSAAYYICHAAWPTFRRQHSGVIVNVSSESARDPFDGFSAYGAAKAGLNLLGKALAREGAALGVRVHTIAPAAVETSMFRKLLTPEQFPADHTLAPEDVARIIMQCVTGDLVHSSGEVIYVHKQIG